MSKRSPTTQLSQQVDKKQRAKSIEDEKIQQVLSVLWNVNEVTALDLDITFEEPMLDSDSVYNVGYLIGKSFSDIKKVQTLTEDIPRRRVQSLMDELPFIIQRAVYRCLDQIIDNSTSGMFLPFTDGLIQGLVPEELDEVCEALSRMNIQVMPLRTSRAIAYDFSKAKYLTRDFLSSIITEDSREFDRIITYSLSETDNSDSE